MTKPILSSWGSVGQMVGVSLLMFLSACATKPATTPKNTQIQTPKQAVQTNIPERYLVKSGDTVSKIATRYGLNWREVSRINGLDANHTIRVGQWLTLRGATPTRPTTAPAPKPPTTTNTPSTNPLVGSAGVMQFGYPVGRDNQVVRHFGEHSEVNGVATRTQGMWFVGRDNDPVMASGAGEIVQINRTDTGNVIDVVHSGGFVSSYMHVGDVKVKQGQRVNKGELIANMKQQPNGATLMEFRIARSGVYIDPIMVLK